MAPQIAAQTRISGSSTGRGSQLNWWDVTLQLLQIVAAGAALFGWVTLVGGARVYARFQASDFPSPIRTVTLVPRDALFAEGLRALWKPLLLGAVFASLWYLILRRDETRHGRLRAALDTRFGDRYQSGGWAATAQIPGPIDPDFRRYVEMRRRDEFGDESSRPSNALLDELDASGTATTSWWRNWSGLRQTARIPWLRIVAGVTAIAGALAVVISLVGDIDFVPALVLLGAVPVAMLLSWLAYRIASAAAHKSFVIFASVVVVWGVVLLIWEWGLSHPRLDYAYIALKGKTTPLSGAYVARLDGDVYWAHKEEEQDEDKKKKNPYKRTWLITTPADEIEQLAIAADEGAAPPLPPDKPSKGPGNKTNTNVLVFPITPTPTPAPTPAPTPGADVIPPTFEPLRTGTAQLNRLGAFGVRLVGFDERVFGVARFITRPSAQANQRRIPLGARVFQAEKGRAPVLRLVLSSRAQMVVRREGVVPVVVRIIAVDSVGNAARTSACVFLYSRGAKRKSMPTRRCRIGG